MSNADSEYVWQRSHLQSQPLEGLEDQGFKASLGYPQLVLKTNKTRKLRPGDSRSIVIPAPIRLRQEVQKFKASLGYTAIPRY